MRKNLLLLSGILISLISIVMIFKLTNTEPKLSEERFETEANEHLEKKEPVQLKKQEKTLDKETHNNQKVDLLKTPNSYKDTPPDTEEKIRVRQLEIQTNEQIKQALTSKDIEKLTHIIDRIETGEVPALTYELPVLRAARACIIKLDKSRKANAKEVLKNSPASTMRKFVRRVCQIF